MKLQRCCLISLLFFISLVVKAQDSLDIMRYQDGSLSFRLIRKTDTLLVSVYSNKVRESVCPLKNGTTNGVYTRFYRNGKIMWKKQMRKGIQEGTALYYDQKGNKVAELKFDKGKIKDTVFIRKRAHILLGRITFSSKVVGGAVREDGQANVSEHSGVYARCDMYVVKTEETKKPVFISNVSSDAYGDFFVVVPEGKLGFYPNNIKIESLGVGHYVPPQQMWNSGHDSWSVKGPMEVKPEDKLLFIELHHASVGYAP